VNVVEFTTRINDGKIDVPLQFQDNFRFDVKVILIKAEHADVAVKPKDSKMARGFGALAHRANPALWSLEDSAWEKAVIDNYDGN